MQMNEEEKQSIEKLKSIVKVNNDFLKGVENQTINQEEIKSIEIALNMIESLLWKEGQQKELLKYKTDVIEKQEKEIEDLKEDNDAWEIMFDTANEREYRKKYIEERRKEQPNLYCPDFDEIYERYYKQKAEIEQLKENYQILKDDLEQHRIVYVDTPEFDENYISKDKIREIKEEYEKERSNMTQIIFSKYGKTQRTFNQAVVNEVIKALDEILGE